MAANIIDIRGVREALRELRKSGVYVGRKEGHTYVDSERIFEARKSSCCSQQLVLS